MTENTVGQTHDGHGFVGAGVSTAAPCRKAALHSDKAVGEMYI